MPLAPSNHKMGSDYRVMFIGDSLMVGITSSSGRGGRNATIKNIQDQLGSAARAVEVGNDNNRMCGTSGLQIDAITIAPYIAIQVKQYKPDLIIIHIGTNDCTSLSTTGLPTLNTSMSNLTVLLNTIRTDAPGCKVLIAKIIDNNTAHAEVVNFNAELESLVEARSDYLAGTLDHVDLYTDVGLYSPTYWQDNTHLNPQGFALWSTSWNNKINTFL